MGFIEMKCNESFLLRMAVDFMLESRKNHDKWDGIFICKLDVGREL